MCSWSAFDNSAREGLIWRRLPSAHLLSIVLRQTEQDRPEADLKHTNKETGSKLKDILAWSTTLQ